ncbi:hypothetical protein OCK74_11975 [Chitinophagaceae bacterium LB-8]|uniref:Signal transduction histidine kinase subgroup 3 dimerisation and phosphoacceptor domain-containing protein n=1 Tax=Paraflavisolibacter caeni TaxID=2982496 RepID=A0A9X2XP39_9BACT|nr:hypothetical protein [Paraflavisolibacter caeni]MCU7549839.1 hypothetical protein [Paraflavisolibacter caeni]
MREELKIGLLSSQIEIQQYKLSVLRSEIDDNISQLLSSIKMLLGVTNRDLYPISDIIKTTQGTLTMAIQELHSLSNSLDDRCFDNFSLIESLKGEIERFNHWKKAHVTFTVSTTSLPLLQHIQLILFNVIIEVIKSNIEHSKQDEILLDIYNKHVKVTIRDGGTPFRILLIPKKSIKKIEYYLKLIGGVIVWPSGIMGGREIIITLPVKKES